MKKTKIIMGMPITVEVNDEITNHDIEEIFKYFKEVDNKYSPYKKNSELTKINNGLEKDKYSNEMKHLLKLCEQTKKLTHGYFNIEHNGKIDTSGLVKGWAIHNAANLLKDKKYNNFYIEAGGDIEVSGNGENNNKWTIGIRNPFNINEIIKVLRLTNRGVATSGTYIRGEHVYNPVENNELTTNIESITVIGPNIYEADRFATAAFAMGEKGINFIESLAGFEAYMIDKNKLATFTRGFESYVA